MDLLSVPKARFWTSSGFRRLVFGSPLASGVSFLNLLWLPGGSFLDLFWLPGVRFLDLLWLPGLRFLGLIWLLGSRFWTSSGFRGLVFGPSLGTSSGFRGLVFGPPLASGGLVFGPPLTSGGSFLDLRWLPEGRFWTSSGFRGLVVGPPLPSGFLDLLWLPDSPDSRFTGLAFPFTCSLAFVFPPPQVLATPQPKPLRYNIMNRQKPFPRNPCRGAQQGSCSHLRTQGRSVGFYHSGVSGPVVWWNSWLVAFFLGYRDTPKIYLYLHLYTVYIYTYIYIYIYIYA